MFFYNIISPFLFLYKLQWHSFLSIYNRFCAFFIIFFTYGYFVLYLMYSSLLSSYFDLSYYLNLNYFFYILLFFFVHSVFYHIFLGFITLFWIDLPYDRPTLLESYIGYVFLLYFLSILSTCISLFIYIYIFYLY